VASGFISSQWNSTWSRDPACCSAVLVCWTLERGGFRIKLSACVCLFDFGGCALLLLHGTWFWIVNDISVFPVVSVALFDLRFGVLD
jgi:hypothetical protein